MKSEDSRQTRGDGERSQRDSKNLACSHPLVVVRSYAKRPHISERTCQLS